MMKKLVALLMALALLCSSIGAFADENTDPSVHNGHGAIPCDDQDHIKLNKEATCKEAGWTWYWCGKCAGEGKDPFFKMPVAKKTHNASDIPETNVTESSQAATCYANSAKVYTCDICGYQWIRWNLGTQLDKTVPENHKNVTYYPMTDSTCTVKGQQHAVCNDCKYEWYPYLELAAHVAGDPVITKQPTDTEYGVKTTTCKNCPFVMSTEYIAPTSFAKSEVEVDPEDYDYTKPVNLQAKYGASVAPHTIGFLKKNSETPATCKAAGSVTYFCADCHKVLTFPLAKLAHTKSMLKDPVVVEGSRKEPTCMENGEVTYQGICKECNTMQTAKEILFADGKHVPDGAAIDDVAPTCTEKGKKTYICKVCKLPYDEPYGEVKGHSWERDYSETNPQPGQKYIEAATCTKDGKYSFAVVCKYCGAIKPGSEDDGKVDVIAKLDHQKLLNKMVEDGAIYETDPKTGKVSIVSTFVATAKSGVLEGAKDYLDNTTKKDDELLTAYGDCTITYVPAKCTEAGRLTIVCDECGAKIDVELTALGHNLENVYGTDAYGRPVREDCTLPNSQLVHCTNEGCDYYENVSLPVKPAHEFTVLVGYAQERTGGNIASYYYWDYTGDKETALASAKAKIALCYDYKEIMQCANCRVETTVDKKGDGKHVMNESDTKYPPIVKPATCTEKGITSFRCEKCGFYQTKIKEALGHDWTSGKTLKEATCTETGVREIYCKVCCGYVEDKDAEGGRKLVANDGHEIVKDTETIPTLPHNWVEHYQAPNCKDGVKGFYYEQCSMCKEKKNEVVLEGHEPENDDAVVWDPKPTCTTPGLASFKCKHCHVRVEVKYAPLGHSYQQGKNSFGVDVIKDIADVEKEHEAASANCTKDCVAAGCMTDAVHTIICTTCKQPLTWTQEKTAIGHHEMKKADGALNKFQILVAPNCTREGKAQYQCVKCEEIVDYVLPKLPHNLVADWNEEEGVYYFYCEEIKNTEAGRSELYWHIADAYPGVREIGEAIYDELLLNTPAGQNFGTFGTCEYEEEIAVKRTEYSISMREDGLGQIALKDKDMLGLTAYVRITWRYELANGDTVGFKACLPVTVVENANNGCKIGTFKPSGLTAPYGSTLIDCFVEVVADADADLKPMGSYATYGSDEL